MTSWKFYDDNAERLFNDYVSLSFYDIFQDVAVFFSNSITTVLDVGAGSGRDAAALADMGFYVTAVEPSERMRTLASSRYKSEKISWVNDSLPLLREVIKNQQTFDLILISAVWMHLSVQERIESLKNLRTLLTPGGNIIITLRLGPEEPDRKIKIINTEELLENASMFGLTVAYVSEIKDDSFNRAQIKWQKVVLTKPIM